MSVNNQPQNKTQKKGKKKEIILLAVIFVIILVVAVIFYGGKKDDGSIAIVTIDGVEYGSYALSEDQEIPIVINGVTTNHLIIKDGMADMIDADCPDQLCVNMKSISMNAETIVCLPNKVVVEVESDTQISELDATAQ